MRLTGTIAACLIFCIIRSLSALDITASDLKLGNIDWISADHKQRYIKRRLQELRQRIPEFNRSYAKAVAEFGDYYADKDEFVPLFEVERKWCSYYEGAASRKLTPVGERLCESLILTYDRTVLAYQEWLKTGDSLAPEPYDDAACLQKYPDKIVLRNIPGTYGQERIPYCVVQREDFEKTPQTSLGDVELEMFAWRARREARQRRMAALEIAKGEFPILTADGKLDVGVYECDPDNWKIAQMLYEVGLIQDIEKPHSSSGNNIGIWCDNDQKAFPSLCKTEYHATRGHSLPCRKASSYWKFTVKSFEILPSICDPKIDKALTESQASGVKFSRYYDPANQVCKVRYQRRRDRKAAN